MEFDKNNYDNLHSEIKKLKSENASLRADIKNHLKTIKDKSRLLDIFTENMFDKIVLCDLQGNYKYIANSQKLLGFDESDLMGKNALSFIHQDDLPHIQASFIDFVSKSDGLIKEEYRLIKADGTYSWLETIGKVLKDDDGNDQEILFCSRDISDKVLYQNELKESEEKLRKIETSSFDAIIMVNDIGNIAMWNPAAEKIFGYSAEEVMGLNAHKLLMPERLEEKFEKGWQNFIKNGDGNIVAKPYESFSNRKDGTELPVEIGIASITIKNKFWAVVYIRDITSRKNYENALLKCDRLISVFLANISHEIRTPMNGIMGFMNLMNDYEFSCDERKDFYDEFKKSGNRLMNTIDELLEVARIETNQLDINLSEFNLLPMMTDLFDEYYFNAEFKGLDFILKNELSSNTCLIHSDPILLKKIISILIKNAIKFTKKGFVEIGFRNNSNNLEIFVKDSGIGIAKDKLDVIFDRFVQAENELTRDYEGNGLGLSIVKSYCDLLNIKIWVESELGVGSIFILEFTI